MTDSPPQPEKIGSYEILDLLSKSSRSRVYKAVQPPSRREVAVKLLPAGATLDPDEIAHFHQEVGALREVNHSNVALILDSGQHENSLFLVMELVPLESLSRILRKRRLTLAQALSVFKNICLGVDAIHEKKVVHRNLNPTSILVSDELSMVKVAGFGSRADRTAHTSEMETLATGRLNVAFHYVAPEQSRGAGPSERSDIYSLGVILYEMLTGRLPMGRVGLPSRINADLPAEIDQLVLDCLASEPEERFASVRQVLEAIRRLEDRLKLGVVNEFTGLVRGTGKVVRHRAVLWAMVGALAVGILALGGWWMLGRDDDGAAPTAVDGSAVSVSAARTGELAGDDLAIDPAAIPPPAETAASNPAPTGDRPESPATASRDESSAPAETTEAGMEPALEPVASAAQDLAVASEKAAAGLTDAALADLEELVADHPRSPQALDAWLMMARIHRDREDDTAALASLVEIRARFADDPRTAEAVYQMAEMTAAKGGDGLEAARELYGSLAADYPGSEWAPKALAARARLEDAESLKITDAELGKRVPVSLATRRDLVTRYPRARYAEEALWTLGEIYRDLKEFDLAVQMYSALGERFPDTRRDAWWEAAQLYEKRLDDDLAAAAAYARVPESSGHFEAAQKRLKKLGKS
jgi:TolA-binding protein